LYVSGKSRDLFVNILDQSEYPSEAGVLLSGFAELLGLERRGALTAIKLLLQPA
jgi:hypothetical protein